MVTHAIVYADARAGYHLAGLSLLKRAILSLKHAGITSCTVVTDQPEHRSALTGDAQINLPTAFAPSFADIAQNAPSTALLLPAHFLYAPQFLSDALKKIRRDGAVSRRCIDRTGDQNRDTGLWYCRSDVLSALAETEADAPESAIRMCAETHPIESLYFDAPFWRAIQTPADIRSTEKAFLKTLIKPTDGFVSRHFNRKVSLWMSRHLVKTPVTPNQISMLTMCLSFWAAWWVATGDYVQMALGGLLFQFASILDGSDGEIAKLKYRQSPRGELVDTLADDASFIAFFAAVVYGNERQIGEPYIFTLGIVAVGLIPLIFLTIHRFLKRAGTRSQVGFVTALSDGASNQKRSLFYRASNALKFACRRDFFSAGICLLLLIDKLEWVYWIFIAGVFWFALVVFGYTGYMLQTQKRT